MELRQVRYFIAVAEEGNFTAAARRVHVTQPPVTRQIRALERELKVTLFRRTPQGTELTDAGREFLIDAREIIARAKQAAQRSMAASRGQVGRLAIGYYGSTVFRAIPDILRHYRTRSPDIQISLAPVPKERIYEALRSRSIHIAFGRYLTPGPDICVDLVEREPLYAALPSTDALSARPFIEASELASKSTIMFSSAEHPGLKQEIMKALPNTSDHSLNDVEVDGYASAFALVSIGAGVAIVPQALTIVGYPGIAFVRVGDDAAFAPAHCAYLSSEQTPALKGFLRSVREHATGQTQPGTDHGVCYHSGKKISLDAAL
jgi:DNA-binding transcriptional LysR family regulator